MVNIVKYLSSTIEEGRRIIQVLRKGKFDVQTAFEAMPFGVDAQPTKDLIAIYAETSIKGKKVIIGYLNKNQLSEVGENRIYSTDENGEVKTFIWLKNDGTMQIGGDSDNMVRYSKLEAAFNEMRADLNKLISDHNAHTHKFVGQVVGVGATTKAIEIPVGKSKADISPAKIDEIKTI